MVSTIADKVAIIFLKKKTIHSKAISIGVPHKAMLAKWTKEANEEN